MAKDRKKLQHIHSSVPDKQPTPSTLAVGEIAVNNAANQEFLSIRNSEDKVKRFSSDEQMITWVEKKEVIPYAGFTRGSDGPTGSTGPNSVTNDDLLQNKSNLIIKFNQVAASNTAKHDVVNGSKDIYNLDVNPTSDSGVTDGAGFAIDMSRYAMIGANPSFSSLTVTDKTDLSGNTTISNGDGSGTRTGNTLKIETTNVNASDSVWEETIITKTEKINSRDTTVGTENLHISGTTTEVRDGNVAETNSGTTNIIRVGNVTEDNLSDTTTNTSGDILINTSGTTTINNIGKTTINVTNGTEINSCNDTTLNSNAVTIKQCSADANGSIAINEKNTDISGDTLNVNETNVIVNSCGEISGKTNAYSMEECETGGTHSVKYHTSSVSGTNLNLTETTSTINSTNTNLTGTNLTIKEDTTTLSSTTATLSGTTLNETFTDGNFNITNYDLNGDNICLSGAIKANVYGATTNVGIDCNGTTTATTINVSGATINEGGTTLNDTFTNINLSGTTKISGTTTIGGATTINNNLNVTGNTDITGTTNISGATKIDDDLTVTGNLYLQVDCGSGITSSTVNAAICESMDRSVITMTKTTPAETSEILATYKLFQNGAQVGEDINIPKDHLLRDVSIVYGKADGSSFTACTSTETDCHWYIKLVWNVNDPSTGHSNDKVTYLPADDFIKDIDDKNPSGVAADSSYNNVAVNVWYDGKQNWVSATTTPTIHASQNIYADGNISGTNITASTAIRANNVSANTITAATDVRTNNVSANTLSAATSIATKDFSASGNGSVSGTLTLTNGIAKKVYWQAGSFTADTTGYNGSADKVITVPTAVSHISRGSLSYSHNGFSGTFDPASNATFSSPHSALSFSYGSVSAKSGSDSYNTSAAKSITIPTSIDHLSNWNGSCINLPHNVCVTGTITASGSIYSSDRDLKENINFVQREDFNKAKNVAIKSFNFKDDKDKNKMYGVIAQETQEAGLGELVYTKEDGHLAVDYTSLMMLKIAYLEDFCAHLNRGVSHLLIKVKELEDKLNSVN